MKDLLLKVIDEYIESAQMREYLKNNIENLQKWQIIDLICGARADIGRKYETLKKLSEFETSDELSSRSTTYKTFAEFAERRLDELDLKSGEVFLNNEYGFDKDLNGKKLYGAKPFSSFQKVKESILLEWKEAIENVTNEETSDMTWWYQLEKYVSDTAGNLQWTNQYIVSPKGEIWFADGGFNQSEDLNLPVPFEIGDIITIDCRPFAPVKHGVIVKKGDNTDCCCIQCAWVKNNGNITAGALKHTSVFDDKIFGEVSPLYRAEVFTGKLPENEKALKEVAEYVKGNEEKGSALWNFIAFEKEGVSYGYLKEYMAENVEKE